MLYSTMSNYERQQLIVYIVIAGKFWRMERRKSLEEQWDSGRHVFYLQILQYRGVWEKKNLHIGGLLSMLPWGGSLWGMPCSSCWGHQGNHEEIPIYQNNLQKIWQAEVWLECPSTLFLHSCSTYERSYSPLLSLECLATQCFPLL